MPIPTVDDAYETLEQRFHGQTGATTIGIQYFTAILQAAATAEGAQTTTQASQALRASIDAFKTAMENNGNDAAKWSRRMAWMTGALIFAALVQAGAAVGQVYVVMNQKPPQITVTVPPPTGQAESPVTTPTTMAPAALSAPVEAAPRSAKKSQPVNASPKKQ